jgi:gliding motility-associated-like protein
MLRAAPPMKPVIFACFYILSVLAGVPADQQAPVVTPKAGPIIVHLDQTGNYTEAIDDIATLTNATSYTVSPSNFTCVSLGPQTVHVVAKNAAPLSQFKDAVAIASDKSGNIYVADQDNYQVKKILPDGTVIVFAGSGTPGNADGTGTAASFGYSQGIAVDANGNVFISDLINNNIRKITPAGVVTTYVQNNGYGSSDGPITTATFSNMHGLAFDQQQNLYVADGGLVRKITPAGMVSTIPNTSFSTVASVVADASENIYLTDYGHNQVKEIIRNSAVTLYAGSGFAGANNGSRYKASFYDPWGIAIDGAGNVYVGDSFNNVIRIIDLNGNVSTFAGSGTNASVDGTGTAASFATPSGLTFAPSGDLYVSDASSGRIRKISPAGVVTTIGQYDAAGTATADIPVTVVSSPVFSPHKDVQLTADATCSVTLPDFTATASVTDVCNIPLKITQLPAPNTPVQGKQPVPVTLTASDPFGGSSQTGFNVQLTDNAGLLPSVTIAPGANFVCPGTPVTFTAVNQNAVNVAGYQWEVNGVREPDQTAVFTTSSLKDNDQIVCYVTGSSGCGTPVASNTFTFHISPLPVVSFKSNLTIPPGANVVLNPQISGDIASYQWSPATGLNDAHIANPVASPAVTTTYLLTVVTTAGCTASNRITVTVSLFVPNTFTPNGDGVNDTWNVAFLDYYPGCMVNIYNRYGENVFHSAGYGHAFDGKANGKALPAGTYYYIIQLTGNEKPLTGFVNIIR